MKKIDTVKFTVDNQLCTSCGSCVSVCPKECISLKRQNGMFVPVIDENACINCGMCYKVCPGLKHTYDTQDALNAIIGNNIKTYNAWSKNANVRHVSASGGVVSTLVSNLLKKGIYDYVVTLDTYNYDDLLKSKIKDYNAVKEIENTHLPKSRYLAVSHENAIKFAKENKDKKIIFIGTSCCVRGFLNSVSALNLNRDNYFIIGLFCDQIFNYNIIDYYKSDKFCKNKQLVNLHFKNKESGGWPGNMKFYYDDGTSEYYDKCNRAGMKAYFMPERCLYCVDKLNVNADISLGDNYTGVDESELGSNSVIIRTEKGLQAWELAASDLNFKEIDIEIIAGKAQDLNWRLNRLCYSKFKEKQILKKTGKLIKLNDNLIQTQNYKDFEQSWRANLKKMNVSKENSRENSYDDLILKVSLPSNILKKYFEKIYYFIKRKI